jgi:hypothetical protein
MIYLIAGILGTSIVGSISIYYSFKLGFSAGLTRAANSIHAEQLKIVMERAQEAKREVTLQ